MKIVRALTIVITAGLAVMVVSPAFAHGFGDRYDLPIPLSFFLGGGAAAVALSFVVIGLFVRPRPGGFDYPRYDLLNIRGLGPLLRSRVVLEVIRIVAVAVFALVVATAIFGTSRPIENLSPAFVWIIWWVGMAYVAALVGNVWRVLNPWKILFEWGEKLLGDGSDERDVGIFRYPERLDVWPALMLFLVFAWLESVYSGASEPFKLGLLVVLYSLITWAGMLLFGKHTWLRHGEAFSVLFGFFARFSPTGRPLSCWRWRPLPSTV